MSLPLTTYLHTLDPFAIKLTETFGIRWYGLSYLSGFLAGYLIIVAMAKRNLSQLSPQAAGDYVFAAAIGTIVGGRLGYCFLYGPDLLVHFDASFPFWGVLAINKGGMASHGGILGVFLASLWFARKHKVSGLHLSDLATLGGAVGIFFGRIANFINGELVGRASSPDFHFAVKFPQDILLWPTSAPQKLPQLGAAAKASGISEENWSQALSQFHFNSLAWRNLESYLDHIVAAVQAGNQAVQQSLEPLLTPRHPSQLYAAFLEGLLVFVILVWIWRKPRKPGIITAYFFIIYSVVRIINEQFRMPDAHIGFQLLGLTRGQWLSFGLLAAGIVCLVLFERRKVDQIGGWKTTKS
ncbi:MAG: prolipoprotein diacylglyceryl transferase [Bdellovibrionales bacterium]|nr:prolipoprotein diacylglyceryl transferase [Bdellovibrionales bacterium]